MTIQHSVIPDGQRHEPKGISTAIVDEVYVANGASSGTWQKLGVASLDGAASPAADAAVVAEAGGTFKTLLPVYGQTSFHDHATPDAWTYSATYTVVNPTTTAGGTASQVTEGVDAKLTYTGSESRVVRVKGKLSIKQTTGSDKDVVVAIAKGGTVIPLSDAIVTTVTARYHTVDVECIVVAALNDEFEIYMKNDGGAGNIDVGCFFLSMEHIA